MTDIISPSQIYWLTRCDSIKNFLDCCPFMIVLFMFSGFIAIITTIMAISIKEYSQDYVYVPSLKKTAKVSGMCSIVMMSLLFIFDLFGVFIPSTKEMAAIIVVPRVANSQSVKELGSGMVDLAKQWMEELAPDKVRKSIENQTETTK